MRAWQFHLALQKAKRWGMERSGTIVQQIGEFVAARVGLLKKAGSFAAVGVVNTLVDFAIFAAAVTMLGLPLVPANVLSWSIAVSGSYVMNSYTTFAAESGRRLEARAYGVFILSGLAGLIANTTALVLASYVVPVLVAKVVAIGVSFLVNFTLSHLVVFGNGPRA
jgi:putative flippase GtrA